jgi:hypothetical protein
MPKFSALSHAAAAAVFAMVALPTSAQSPPPAGAEAGWAAMTKCAAIADEKSRHRCSDEVLRNAGLVPSSAATAGKEASVPTPARSAATDQPSRPSDFGLPPKPVAALPPPSPNRVDVVLASVAKGEHGALVFETADGATWRQVDAEGSHPMPKAGQTMTIQKAPLGGFLCKPEKQVFFRCSRAS